MAIFTYTAYDEPGSRVHGQIRADSLSGASRVLALRGIYPIEIEPLTRSGHRWLPRRSISPRDLAELFRGLNDLLEAGLPLIEALEVLEEQVSRRALRELLREIVESVAAGTAFSSALGEHPTVFAELIVNTVRSGEVGGVLTAVLPGLADFHEAEAEARARFLSVLIYPVLVTGMGILTVYVLLTLAIPRIAVMFEDMGQALPWPTRLLVAMSDAAVLNWQILSLLLLALVGTIAWIRHRRLALAWRHGLILRLPVAGQIVRLRELSRFARALSIAIEHGVPVVRAVQLATDVVRNAVLHNEFRQLVDDLKSGVSLGAALRQRRHIPAMVGRVVSVGEESADLARALRRLAENHDRQIERSSRVLTSVVEPAVIVVMGLLVAFIVFAMMLPVFSMDALLM